MNNTVDKETDVQYTFGGSIIMSTLKPIDRQLVSFKYLCIEYRHECPCPQQPQPPSCTAFLVLTFLHPCLNTHWDSTLHAS